MWAQLCVIVPVLILLPSGFDAACIEFPEIEESNYDRNYSTINDVDKRPLGFHRSTFYFNPASDSGDEQPCFIVKGIDGRSVEVRFQTVPSMKLCFRDQTGQPRCEENNFEECLSAVSNEMTYTFYCDVSEGCSESDVNFWVRFTKGPAPHDDREMMWCGERDSEYPESLRPLPPIFTVPTTPKPVDAAASVHPSVLLLLTLLCLFKITL